MSDDLVDLEMQSPAQPLPTATGTDEEEHRQCWRDVEAETGHSSYKSFLEALPETEPQYRNLRGMIGVDHSSNQSWEVRVLNILEDGGMSISMNLEGRSKHSGVERDLDLENQPRNWAQLLRNLRSPPENITARIIVWSMPRGFSLHAGLVDAIGLGLKIQPVVFETLSSMFKYGSIYSSGRHMESNYVTIGNSIAIVARNYVPNERVPPVLFVAKVRHIEKTRHFTLFQEDYDDMFREALTSEIYGSMSLCRPASDMHSLKDLVPEFFGYLDRLSDHVYLKLLSKYIQNGADVDVQGDGSLLNAMLPLLHLEVLDLHVQCEITHKGLFLAQRDQDNYQSLDERRFELRTKLEDLEESRKCFVKFARLQNAPGWLETQAWMSQEKEIIEVVNKARAKEAEARDHMQLHIGNLSIEESRKSIQLSNQQMSEAKRVKIFTVLAFIYIPINLATSVFGMNLKQLNDQGQSFWSFLVTALVALLITGFVWFSFELYNIVAEHKQRKHRLERRYRPKEQLRIGVRVAILLGLIKKEDVQRLRKLGNK